MAQRKPVTSANPFSFITLSNYLYGTESEKKIFLYYYKLNETEFLLKTSSFSTSQEIHSNTAILLPPSLRPETCSCSEPDNRVQDLPNHFLKIYFNIIPIYAYVSEVSLFVRLPQRNPLSTTSHLHMSSCHMIRPSFLLKL